MVSKWHSKCFESIAMKQDVTCGKRILLIEDDRAARESTKLLLNIDRHTVTEAEDGIAGLSLIAEQPFDLVVVDWDGRWRGRLVYQTHGSFNADLADYRISGKIGWLRQTRKLDPCQTVRRGRPARSNYKGAVCAALVILWREQRRGFAYLGTGR